MAVSVTPKAHPEPAAPGTKVCRKCGESKPLLAFMGKRNTCVQCRDAAKARTLERKERIEYSETIAEKIVDGVASGLTFAEICAPAGMPTVRQLTAWRRHHPELADAMDAARTHRATIRSDRIDETLAELRAQKISAADARTIIDAEMKLMALEDPARFNPATKVQAEVSGPNGTPLQMAVVDDASLIKAARWVADLLSRANAAPVIDLKPANEREAARTRPRPAPISCRRSSPSCAGCRSMSSRKSSPRPTPTPACGFPTQGRNPTRSPARRTRSSSAESWAAARQR